MVRRLHHRLRLRHPARRSADPRLSRRPVVGALGRRRHRPRRQDAGRRLRLGRRRRPSPAASGSGSPPASPRPSSFSLIHGYASIDQRANQIVSGTAINMVADGLTALIGNAIWSQGGRTPQLPDDGAVPRDRLPFVQRDRRRSDLGPIYQHLISGHDLITYRRLPDRAADLLGALQHALRPAAARGRREPGRGRHGGHFGPGAALQRRRHLRRAGRPRRRLSGAVAGGLFPAAHVAPAAASSRSPRSSSPSGGRGRRWRPACCSASSTRWRSGCRASNCR